VVEHPFIYEVNTWVWLDELRARLGKEIGRAGVSFDSLSRHVSCLRRRRSSCAGASP
jgi:hypothetical protein